MTRAADLPEWMQERVIGGNARVELAPDEASVATLFLALDTQWTLHAMTGVRLGIDYSRVVPTAELMKIVPTPSLFLDLRVMESAALGEFARKVRR